ncbi:MAG TPA: metal-sulfur cluster assembly factor, partial [Opitutus sp.]|nr:metal-sulfur cluster assembly factor [Opitutus sp.]
VECAEREVHVVMTLTTPTCPSGAWIHEGVQAAVRQLPGVGNVRVDVVFEPAWSPEMLSAKGRRELGWPGENES